MSRNSELLTDMSFEELEALAESSLAPAAQAQLDDLLTRKREQQLSNDDQAALDRLLQKTDNLTLLKTRARYTLSRSRVEAAGT